MTRPLLVLVLALAARSAHADPAAGVGVVVTGEATIQPQLATQLEIWLQRHGHQLVTAPLPPDAINTIVDCFVIEDEGCARGVVEKRSKARSVVYARIDVQSSSTALQRDVIVTAYWFDKGVAKAITQKKTCERCTEASLKVTAAELMSALANAGQKTGRLECNSEPAGAEVSIDGRRIGTTPLSHELAPGPHKIDVSHEHSGRETRDIVVVAGETVTLDVPLPATGGGEGRGSRALPAVTVSAGVALLATGVVMFAIDEDDSASPDAPRFIRNTGPTGVGLAIAGAAVTVGGLIWFRASKRSAPVAAVSSDGAYVGWMQRF